MVDYGVTSSGFVDKPLDVILSEIENDQRTEIRADIDVSKDSPIGQLNQIFASHLRQLWEVLQATYSSFYPDSSSGASLAKISALTGTIASQGTKTTIVGRLTVSPSITVPAGIIAYSSQYPGMKFKTLAAVTNNTLFEADFDVDMEALVKGPFVLPPNSLNVIQTPVAGLLAIDNFAASVSGELADTDATLRIRREEELRSQGKATLDAIRSEILQVPGVLSCKVYENLTDTTDEEGLPSLAFEAVVLGGNPALIADAIWRTKAAGVRTHGTTTETVLDSQGDEHDVLFTIPADVELDIEVDIDVDAEIYPEDGDDQIKQALVEWADANLGVGADYVLAKQHVPIFGIAGVKDITRLEAGEGSVSASNVIIGSREIGRVDVDRITVTSTPTTGG